MVDTAGASDGTTQTAGMLCCIKVVLDHQQGLICFAHTFNGQKFLDSADLSELSRAKRPDLSLRDLRCLLFLSMRADRWDGGMRTDWPMIWDLVAAIRWRVEAGASD